MPQHIRTNSAGGAAGTLQGIFPVTPTPTAAPVTPAPLTFTVNPMVDLAVVMMPGFFGEAGYQEYIWNCATVAAAERLQAYLAAKLGLSCTIGFAYPDGPPVVVQATQSAYTVPYFTFALNADGSIPGPPGNSNIAIVGGLLLEYYQFPTSADANTLSFYKAT
jgi:hypothetical protein